MIAVGDSGDVELIFTTAKGQKGMVNKSATVTCNDNNRASFGLVLKGLIYPTEHPDSLKPVNLSQSRIRWDPENEKREAKLIVTNVSDTPLKLNLVAAAEQFINVEIPHDVIKPGKSKEIKVKLAKDFTEAAFKKSFTFECTDPAKTRFTVPVELAIVGPVAAPAKFEKPPLPTGKQRAVDSTKVDPHSSTGSGKTH